MNQAVPDSAAARRARYAAVFIGLLAAFAALTVWNINSGSVHISVADIARIIFLHQGDDTQMGIIWKLRLPRIVASAVLGGGLALSGFLMQTFFGNPIAGPFVLGISSGSKLFVALTMIVALRYISFVSSWMMVAAAFVGALIAMGFVLLAARSIRQMSMLLVAGIMISYICSAVTEFLITFAKDSDIVNLHTWSQGSFSGTKWADVRFFTLTILICFLVVFLLSKPIGAYQMGEAYAQSMGVNVKRFRVVLILMSSLIAGCVTAFAGPISFVGIAVPHLIKMLLKTARPILVIPASFLGGGVFCMFCDYIARTAFAPVELSISTVTALFGAPVVIAMLIRRHGGRM
ncbi:MAG: iron ABC transporter permease [Ruminococcaceae bacterium]|jgi:iron complex transport system permease protein|nr:iron ABC transporter permease [Oscillospiraceae bacterium]